MPLPGDTDTLTGPDRAALPRRVRLRGMAVDATGQPWTRRDGRVTGWLEQRRRRRIGATRPRPRGRDRGVDLWDSGWPSGRFYGRSSRLRRVHEAAPGIDAVAAPLRLPRRPLPRRRRAPPRAGGAVTYHDMAVPQDSCQSGLGHELRQGLAADRHVLRHARTSRASGPTGRNVAAVGPRRRRVRLADRRLAARRSARPSTGSRCRGRSTRGTPSKHVGTPATSIVLPVTKFDAGTWYYRVRGDQPEPARRARRRWPGRRRSRSRSPATVIEIVRVASPGHGPRPPLRSRARRRGRRDHHVALPRARPARRDQARPDARQRGRPGRRGGDPRARRRAPARRDRVRRGARRRRRGRPLDRRPDRRHTQLRSRQPGLGER